MSDGRTGVTLNAPAIVMGGGGGGIISEREENSRRNYFIINLHESMGPGRDQTPDHWICSQTRICSQPHNQLHHAAGFNLISYEKL